MRKFKTYSKRFIAVMLSALMVIGCMAVSIVSASAAGNEAPDYVKNSTEKAAWARGVRNDTTQNIEAVKWQYIDGKYYWFLPSSANLNELVIYHNFNSFELEGTPITSGAYKIFPDQLEQEYNISIEGNNARLVVQKANGIGSMFITTESGTMSNINSDKNVKEKGQLVVVDYDGSVSYDSTLKQIKGRGNSTWRLSKKPYNISLDDTASLFGLSKSKKWCLLANAQDHSMIRNRFIYDLASEVGVLSPGSKFADVYSNGEYLGTYQVSEKVEVGKNNLVKINDLEGATEKLNDKDLDEYAEVKYTKNGGQRVAYQIPNNPTDITGGYLVEFVVDTDEACYFKTSRGQGVNLKGPEYLSVAQMDYIADFVQDMEDAVFSSTGYNSKNKHYTDYLDQESAVLMYLIQEYSMNMDAGISSCYFYMDSVENGDGKLHAGPAWDFDITLGNIDMRKDGVSMVDYSQWFVNKSIRSGSNQKTIWSALYQHSDFAQLAEELWETKMTPALDIAFGNTTNANGLQSLTAYGNEVESSSKMNYTIWSAKANSPMTDAGNTHKAHLNYLLNWASERRVFLDTAEWNNNPSADKVLYYDNSETKWKKVCAYTWGGSSSVSWPGTEMTHIGNDIYKITIKGDEANIIFNNGTVDGQAGKEQTKDLTPAASGYIYAVDFTSGSYDSGKKGIFYSAGAWKKYVPVTQDKYGDLNSDTKVDLTDIVMAQKIVAELIAKTDFYNKVADVNGDGEIDLVDIVLIQKHVAEIITKFPVEN